MVDRPAFLPKILQHLRLGLYARAWTFLRDGDGPYGWRLHQLPSQQACLDDSIDVLLRRQKIWADQRSIGHLCRGDLDAAPAARAAWRESKQESGVRLGLQSRAATLGNRIGQWVEVELDVRIRLARPSLEKASRLIDAERQRAATRQEELQSGAQLAAPAAEIIVQRAPVGTVEIARTQVVLQILTDGWGVVHDRQAVSAQQRRSADAREL